MSVYSDATLNSHAPSGYGLQDDDDIFEPASTYVASSASSMGGPAYQHSEDIKPGWTSSRLKTTLKKANDIDDEDNEPTPAYGLPQFLLMVVTFLMFCFVAGCMMMSKLSFLSLSEKFQLASKKKDGSPESHAALLLMTLTILVPQALGVIQSVLKSCYKSRRSNPSPSVNAMFYILLVALLEATGISLYVLLVVPQVPSALCLVIMNGVFAVPALVRCLSSKKGMAPRRGVDEPLLNIDNPSLDEMEAVQSIGFFEKSALWTACGAQLGAAFYVPMYMLANDDVMGKGPAGIDTAVLTAASMLMISVAWLPSIQDKMVVPHDPNHRFNARLKAGMLCGVLKVGFTIAWMVLLVKNAEGYDLDTLGDSLDDIGQSDLLWDFVVHIVGSHFGYHAARMACAMSIQPLGFAAPLTLVTPLSLIVVMTQCTSPDSTDVPMFLVTCLDSDANKAMLVVIAVVLWASQNIIVFRNAWNSRSPLLALDEMLFYQPSYNSVLLEQYTLLNRREPNTFSELVDDDPDDPSVRVYICSTVYRESAVEMKQLIGSCLRLDKSVSNVFEWHVWMDGGCSGNQLGQYAIQFVACLKEEMEKDGDVNVDDWVESGQKMETPYGQRLEWVLPNGTPFAMHLKDPALVKRGKRWSQVMYMFYLLQFRVPREHPRDTSASYILTTDADIIFKPEDVQALVVLLSRDKRVGACCGRTYPKGSGPVFWYQIFDYAVGHWFQKSSEHVLGTVLCCPGCFSLYRVDALRDCLLKYASSVTEAFDFLTKDMGEDRWLCTLLIMNGWRLDYTAVSSNTTFCPEGFDEFFNQRRRWIVSTLANQVEMLTNWRRAVRMNDSVSLAFMIYQVGMIFSSLVAPATTILVIMGGVKYSLESDLEEIMIWLGSSMLFYCGILLTCNREIQLLVSKVYTAGFAILMGAVIVGVLNQIAIEIRSSDESHSDALSNSTAMNDDGSENVDMVWRLSVTTVYLAGMVAMFIIAAMVHPTESVDVLYGILYLLCLPGGYLVLMLYAIVNLDDRSWGTRTEALRKQEQGSMSDGIRTMLRGCGIWEGEGLSHFAGRMITCRCHNPPPDDTDPKNNPYLMISSEEHKPCVNDKAWVLTEDGSTARCAAVDTLVSFLNEHENDDDLAAHLPQLIHLTEMALQVCPSLSSWGQWSRCWNSKSRSFRCPRGTPSETDTKFWQQMRTDIIAHMEQNYTWPVVDRYTKVQLPDGHMRIAPWLESLGLADAYLGNLFLQHGYDDTTFLIGLTEGDFRELGMPSTLTGRANIRKVVDAVRKLPNNDIPNSIPPSLTEWLESLCLTVYVNNFERCGYSDSDLALCEGLTQSDLQQMGIIKQGHLNKLLKGVDTLTKLLIQGRSPEGKSAAMLKVAEIRDLVAKLPEASVESTYFAPRLVLSEEESFWSQVVSDKLDPKLESISNVDGLKQKLRQLRNVAIIVLFMLNALWIVLMVELAQEQTQSLNIFHTNPLGFVFLMVYGTILVVQFMSMLWHRLATAVQYIASVPFPGNTESSKRHQYAELRP